MPNFIWFFKQRFHEKPILDETRTPAVADSFIVVSDRVLSEVIEEEVVNFKAILIANGIKRDVTKEVEWKVVGSIGDINNQGVFTARLFPEVAEFGEVSGTVVAIWKDLKTNEAFLGKSSIFKVKAKVALDTNIGG